MNWLGWFGLDWTDIIINTLVLSILPGLGAAYGGHLAAEAIADPKRSRKIKYCFWALFVFGVIATFWQQFRVAEADLARNTTDTWVQVLALTKFLPPPPPANIARGRGGIAARSYVTFGIIPHFDKEVNGQLIHGAPFAAGDQLFFNVDYKATGPNPVDVIGVSRWLYVEPDATPETQKRVIADFEAKLGSPHAPTEPFTVMPGDERFFTAFATTASKEIRIVTNDDLEQFKRGTQVSFVIAKITYRDKGETHHARRCEWLQAPAEPPGIWQFCRGFGKSD